MKARSILYTAALVVTTAAITSQVVSQNTKDKPKTTPPSQVPQGMPQLTPDEQAVMNAMQECSVIGENHKLLENHIGKWTGTMKWWMTPESQPMESSFNAESKWELDKHYIHSTAEGQMMPGETFQGVGYMGYDNAEKKYFTTWFDNTCTGLMVAKGTFDPAKKTFTYTSSGFCPLAKKEVTFHMTEKWTDNDHYTLEMTGPWYKTGKDFKNMEITYTRAK